MGSGKTTSFDIAHRAGVSQATVSRALRNSPLVNPETRKKIQRIAREMNYQVDRSAAGLRSQRSNTIALLLFEDPTTDDSRINPFFLSMLGNITRSAVAEKFDVLVSFQHLSDDWVSDYQTSNRADGIILLGYGDYGDISHKLQRLHEEGANIIIWGATTQELEGHAVGSMNKQGGEMATQHLLSLGRKKIAFIGNLGNDSPEFQKRFDGYKKTLQDMQLPLRSELRIDSDNHEDSGFSAMAQLLASGEAFDAVIAASDMIAIGALKCLRKSGFEIPRQVSVVGFDDIPAASYSSPSLTTVRQDTRAAARIMVRKLVSMINGEPVKTRLLPMSLVIRGSCGGRVKRSSAETSAGPDRPL
ncbi:MAG: LacI family DNA-binding transcriptional regulator [Xanthomonadales bacterium]|nr:LacI family DNA-binding transcriptional regulator [Xanthomonadales bacterium]